MRNNTRRGFIIRLIVLTVIISISAWIFGQFAPSSFVSPALPFIILFFFISTLVVYYILINSFQRNFSRFTSNFMLATFLKLMLFMIIIVVYAFLNKKDAVAFIISFFIIYLIYTIYEVISILSYKQPE